MSRTTFTHRILPLLAAGLLLGACDDDPTTVEDHLAVEGIAIFEGTTEIYRYTLDDGAPSPFTISQGPHDVTIVLLGDDGQPLSEEGDEDGEEHVLEVDIADTGVLRWIAEDHTDVHDFISFQGQLNALQPGSTTMQLCIPHGEHCDFEVADGGVPVTVTEP